MKQGMKTDQAASLVEMTSAKCSTVKYDVELAEEYIARQVTIVMPSLMMCVFIVTVSYCLLLYSAVPFQPFTA